MVRLSFSNALEPLTVALAGDLRDWRAGDLERLLQPVPIAVPDRLVARYLNLEIAKLLGAAVNLRFPFLSGLLEGSLGPALSARLLTRERITERIAIALGDEDFLGQAIMAPARGYVETGDPFSSAARRAELSVELTRLYLDYQATRPLELAKIARGENFGDPASEWQSHLWRKVLEPASHEPRTHESRSHESSSDEADSPPMATLVELITSAKDDELRVPPIMFVVGGSRMAYGHRLMLERLMQLTDVRIYAFNPCRQFWEDIEKSPDECPPLAYWGGAGRSPIKQLSELAAFDFDSLFVAPGGADDAQGSESPGDDILSRLKLDILDRASRRSERAPLRSDNSIRVISAPSIRRELEHIGETIWTLVRSDSTLKLTEVGVLLAGSDRDLYRAQVGEVFGGLANLAHHISLVPLTFESRVAEAFGYLLELTLGAFTRPQMLRVLTHPAVIGADAEIDPADWTRWIMSLGVFFGGDGSVHNGTYLSGDVYHWDQAILRLSLGACVEHDPDEHPVNLANRTVLPHPQTAEKRRSASRLCLLARSLIADISWMKKQSLSLSAWVDVLWRFASAYIEPQSDKESAELGRCLRALTRIGDSRISAPIPMATAVEIARAAVASLETRRGEPLTEGVCVAPLASPPLVPFRHVFVAGLSGGAFPATESAVIDARSATPSAAEPSPSARDRYAFLHALLSARETLTVSYVGRDAKTGERLPPSSVVSELTLLATSELATSHHRQTLELELPVWAHDDPATESRGVNVAARLRSRASSLARADNVGVNRSRRAVLTALRRGSDHQTRTLLGIQDPIAPEEPQADRELSAPQLARFLNSPIDAWGQVVLGLGSSHSTDRTSATEPLDLSPIDRSIMSKEAVCGLAIDGGLGTKGDVSDELARRLRRAADRLLSHGTGPSGLVASWQIDAALEDAMTWWQVLRDETELDRPSSLAIGRASEGADIRELLPAVVVGAEPYVETHGLFPLIAIDGSAQVYFHRRSSIPWDKAARAVVDHLLLAAAGRVTAPAVTIHFVGSKSTQTLEIDAFDRELALKEIDRIASSLLYSTHAYELPGEAVFANHLKGKELEVGLKGRAAQPGPDYGRTVERKPREYELPNDLGEILETRYRPLLARIRRLT